MATSFLAKIVILSVLAALSEARPQSKYYPLRLQPELDSINIEDYLKNEKLVDLQVQCVIYDGPCDAVGRWIKPRVAASFLGQCPLCTPTQQTNVVKIIKHFQARRPEAYNRAVVKFLREAGVDLQAISRTLVAETSATPDAAAAPAPVVPLALNVQPASVASLAPLALGEAPVVVSTSTTTTAVPEVVTTTTEVAAAA